MLERARTAARAPEWAGTGIRVQGLHQRVRRAPVCLKSITAARLEARPAVTLKEKTDHLQHCQSHSGREMAICDLSQSRGRNGGQIPMV